MERTFKLDLLDLVTIAYHISRGAQMEEVGFEDCDRTLAQLIEDLSPRARIPVNQSAVESGLWSCNLMDEAGQFVSFTGESFDDFLKRLLRYAPKDDQHKFRFDKFYNLLKKTE